MSNTILDNLESHLRDNKPFLKNGYTIRDLSAELGIPVYQISALINKPSDCRYLSGRRRRSERFRAATQENASVSWHF